MNGGEMFLIRSMVFSQAPKSAITRSVTGQRHFSYDWIDCRLWSSPARTAAHFHFIVSVWQRWISLLS